jgi:hypothetical protein
MMVDDGYENYKIKKRNEKLSDLNLLENLKIIDDIFKSNGHIYSFCLDEHTAFESAINGFSILEYDEEDSDYIYHLIAEDFRFLINAETIFFCCTDSNVFIELNFDGDYTNKLVSIEDFKSMILHMVNRKLEFTYKTIDDFVDSYNAQYMTL